MCLGALPNELLQVEVAAHILILYNTFVSCLPCSNYDYAGIIIV